MIYDLIILGGGPAGIAAGIYASRKKINTLLLTKNFGGQAINSAKIENFIGFEEISGFDFAKTLERHLKAQKNIEVKDGVEIVAIQKNQEGFILQDKKGNYYKSKNLFYGLGSNYKKLGVLGEKEYEGRGVFYCSICDAPIMKDKKVVVVGGGNSGVGATLDLIPYASKITILEFSDKLTADLTQIEKISSNNKIEIVLNAQVEEIFGAQSGFGADFVNKIKYKDRLSGEEKYIDTDGVFVSVGYAPNTVLLNGMVEMNEKGKIIVDNQTGKTSQEGIWAAGDCSSSLYNQINIAIGDGIKAILNIYDKLEK